MRYVNFHLFLLYPDWKLLMAKVLAKCGRLANHHVVLNLSLNVKLREHLFKAMYFAEL